MSLAPGARLGAYEIVALLGAGGMGEVYRARDTRLGRDVAIKILPAAFVSDPERHARFEREARVISQLNHPNICGFYHIGDAPALDPANPQSQTSNSGTMQFLVLELVEGSTLANRIAQGPLPLEEALPIARQIADALEAAHEHGIVHRDLKPANIKIRPDGTVKVLDFGLAKAMEPAASSNVNGTQSPTITSPAMTVPGIILGTAAYMSPEQARGSSVDRRADLWAFGVVLYEMLAGRRLFEGTTISDTLASVLKSEPDWTALPAQTPMPIRRLLRRCLEKDRRRRLDSAADARLELEDALAAPSEIVQSFGPEGATPTRPLTSWRRLAVVGLMSAIVAGAAVGAMAWRRVRAPAPVVARFSVLLGEGQSFTNTNDPVVAMSPDGTRIAYVANRQLYLRALSDSAARPIMGTQLDRSVRSPVFSPDGESIVFSDTDTAGGALKKIAVGGGAAVTLCSAVQTFGISWGTDGIVFSQPGGIMRVSASGGQPELLVATKDGEIASYPQVLPDGRTMLFTVGAATGPASRFDNARIVMQSLASGERKTLIEGGSGGQYSPSGHLLYAVQGVLFAVPFDATRLAVTGGPVPVIEGVARGGSFSPANTTQFSLSSTGSLVYLTGPVGTASGWDLAWLDRRGLVEPLKLPPAAYTTPRLSLDGRRIAFVTDDGKDANVWIFDLAGSGAPRRLTFGGRNRFPVWSSDGGRVAFQSDREGDLALFWQNSDGTGPAERLTKPEPGTAHVPYSWAPDGKHLLFGVVKGVRSSLWTYAVADRQSVRFGQAETSDVRNAVFSPDGRWVAYSAGVPTQAQTRVLVQPFPATGATYQVSRPETQGNNPFWSPDGGELFYGRGPGDLVVVRITTQPAFSVSSPLATPFGGRLAEGGWRHYDISRDGKRFLVVVPFGQGNIIERPEVQIVLNWFEELKRRMPAK